MTPSERQKRYRRRCQRGLVVLRPQVELYSFVETLIHSGRITPEAALDRDKLDKAAAELINDWVARWPAKETI